MLALAVTPSGITLICLLALSIFISKAISKSLWEGRSAIKAIGLPISQVGHCYARLTTGRGLGRAEMRRSAASRCCRAAILAQVRRGREVIMPKGRRCLILLARQGHARGKVTPKRATLASSGLPFRVLSRTL